MSELRWIESNMKLDKEKSKWVKLDTGIKNIINQDIKHRRKNMFALFFFFLIPLGGLRQGKMNLALDMRFRC